MHLSQKKSAKDRIKLQDDHYLAAAIGKLVLQREDSALLSEPRQQHLLCWQGANDLLKRYGYAAIVPEMQWPKWNAQTHRSGTLCRVLAFVDFQVGMGLFCGFAP